jgi:prepilin-type N-terminal cleavage/methylation domain-containing protein
MLMVRKGSTTRRGFTLIEAALATVIVGIGIVATLQLLAVGTSANVDGTQQTTALNLTKGVREMSLKLSFADVLALHGDSYQPPKDSRGVELVGFDEWRQTIEVRAVHPDRLATPIVDPTPDMVRVTVRVTQNDKPVSELSWFRARPMP